MSKKERSTLTRIERENVNRIGKAAQKQQQRLLITSLEKIPGTLIEHVELVDSPPPDSETWAAMNDILSSCPSVYYKPRKRKVYTWDDSQLRRWQCLGFESLNHYLTYNAMNNTVAGARDFDELFNIGDKYKE
ncbi:MULTISPECIES: hypothetical protein [Enterobacteriaceae]|uniref:hypothetical protein n=1 Tax=Enterobacteriaceae TaxID=543 RepID=UPI001C4688EA|nr:MULTISPECIES: hypothetical protein [Enterobacteriaceae]MBV7406980.1 hypothetical protein [Enterobacter sp. ENT03]QXZ21203.1 hypothetical protein I6L75_08770 [Lelliottia amnigena]